MADVSASTDETLLDRLQHAAFGYFLETVNPTTGLVADTSRANSPSSIAVVGFALSVYVVAVERGWMGRPDAVKRCLSVLRFFRHSDQSDGPEATGYKGFYYHFLDLHTGARVWRSELSMVDTAFLIAGALTAGMYFTSDTSEETELRELVEALYLRVDWKWSQGGAVTIRQGWKPECGFLHYGWEGYNEATILYVLAMGSPTHALTGDCYEAWTATYQWKTCTVTIFYMRVRCSYTSSHMRGSIFAEFAIASCARSAVTISRTAGARRSSRAHTPGATRTNSQITTNIAGASLRATDPVTNCPT